MSSAVSMLKVMFGINSTQAVGTDTLNILINNIPLIIVAFFVSLGGLNKFFDNANDAFYNKSTNRNRKVYGICCIVFVFVVLLLSTISLVGSSYNPFLYFRF